MFSIVMFERLLELCADQRWINISSEFLRCKAVVGQLTSINHENTVFEITDTMHTWSWVNITVDLAV